MKWADLLTLADDEPVFETGLLMAGDVNPADVRRQLSRWVGMGRLVQLRRGLYSLAPPYRKVEPHLFVVANRMALGSYVSCQSALGFHGLIPEAVPGVTSVYTGRPFRRDNALGRFFYRHVREGLQYGFERVEAGSRQHALVASPEKALLDLVHLTPEGDGRAYLGELRLQNVEQIDPQQLHQLARRAGSPKLQRAAANLERLIAEIDGGYEAL